MKKLILSLFAIASLAIAAHAVTNMYVKTDDGKVSFYNVDQVKQVYYREYIDGVVVSGWVGNHSYVDLGLPSGTKWATYNVGATKPTEYGDYFAWGETKPKAEYSWNTYKWCNGSRDSMTKYCTDSGDGTVDNKTLLDVEDDAATANWGSAWRMPTKEEIDELIDGCDWKWVKYFNGGGVNGQLGTSKKNGATIFLPAAGFRLDTDFGYAGNGGYYWSSSLYRFYDAYNFSFERYGIWLASIFRRNGYSVRAVLR